ncbi:hypothetical protein COP2_027998 [Malus domestica]
MSRHENARKGKENLRGGAALDADQQAIHIRLNSMASQHSPSKLKDQVENIASVTSENCGAWESTCICGESSIPWNKDH